MKRSTLVLTGLAAISALGFGAYYVTRVKVCASLEKKYLNEFAGLGEIIEEDIRYSIPGEINDKPSLQQVSTKKRLDSFLAEIKEQCGASAVEAAFRKASGLI